MLQLATYNNSATYRYSFIFQGAIGKEVLYSIIIIIWGKHNDFGYHALKNGSNIQLGIGLHEDMQHIQFGGDVGLLICYHYYQF
jgi:hypothetical protein